ncbi:MAG: nitroreductase family protein [Candidatus Woesearchaeota archaeon]
MTKANNRTSDVDIDSIFLERWSPRAMLGKPLKKEELMQLFEAARWAPSASNSQPWRFVYAIKGTESFNNFLDILMPGNQRWCSKAGALIIVVTKVLRDDGQRDITASFSTGAAWQNLALQGAKMNLVVHGMQGFDYGRAAKVIEIPPGFEVQMMIAVGYPGNKTELPEDLQARELPSNRNKTESFAFESRFTF